MEGPKFSITTLKAELAGIHAVLYLRRLAIIFFITVVGDLVFGLIHVTILLVTNDRGLNGLHRGFDADHIDVGLDVPVFELVYNLHLSYFLGLFGPDVHDGPLDHVFDLGDLRVIFDLARDSDRVLIAFLVLLVQIFQLGLGRF